MLTIEELQKNLDTINQNVDAVGAVKVVDNSIAIAIAVLSKWNPTDDWEIHYKELNMKRLKRAAKAMELSSRELG